MPRSDDPFRHHPGLRKLIIDPMTSQFRDFEPASFDEMMRARGLPDDWRYSDAEREADRARILALRPEGPLWVFAYGSLMWDPALRFAEVLRAHAPLHERRMILLDTLGGRGTEEDPGLMAALDDGTGCHGLVFRIEDARIDYETRNLFARERIMPAYVPVFIPVETDFGTYTALTFVADHAASSIAGDLERENMVRHIAQGEGFLGTSLDYARNLVRHLEELGIPDPDLGQLLLDAEEAAR